VTGGGNDSFGSKADIALATSNAVLAYTEIRTSRANAVRAYTPIARRSSFFLRTGGHQ
jgi:hypothetical protein